MSVIPRVRGVHDSYATSALRQADETIRRETSCPNLHDAPVESFQGTKDLNLHKNYLSDHSAWTCDTSLRELVQNYRDQVTKVLGTVQWETSVTSFGNQKLFVASIASPLRTVGGFILEEQCKDSGLYNIYLVNYATRVTSDILTIGNSSKAKSVNMAGAFGEGLKVASNILTSQGIKVRVFTGGNEWTFRHDQRGVLEVEMRQSPEAENAIVDAKSTTVFMVSNFPHEFRWQDFVFLYPPQLLAGRTLVTPVSRVMLGKEFAGKVFVKGIFIMESHDLKKDTQLGGRDGFGIDLHDSDTRLTRERNFVHDRDLIRGILHLFTNASVDLWYQVTLRADFQPNQELILFNVLVETVFSILSQPNSRMGSLLARETSACFAKCMWRIFEVSKNINVPQSDQEFQTKPPKLIALPRGTPQKVKDDYEYFLRLGPDFLIECESSLLSVLESYRKRKSIEEYLGMFWLDLLAQADFPFSAPGQASFLQWVREFVVKEIFQAKLDIRQFMLKSLPPYVTSSNVARATVKVINTPEHRGAFPFSQAIIVDCEELFQCCKCSSGGSLCVNNCIETRFMEDLKQSMRSAMPQLTAKMEEYLTKAIIKTSALTGRNGGVMVNSQRKIDTEPPRPHPITTVAPSHQQGVRPTIRPDDGHRVAAKLTAYTADTDALPGYGKQFVEGFYGKGESVDLPPWIVGRANDPLATHQKDEEHAHGAHDCGDQLEFDLTFVAQVPLMQGKVAAPFYCDTALMKQGLHVQQDVQRRVLILGHIIVDLLFRLELPNLLSRTRLIYHHDPCLNAFIKAGDLHFNVSSAGFESVLASAQSLSEANVKDLAMVFWMVTLCHELAHNVASQHDRAHEQEEEKLLRSLLPKLLTLRH